MERRTFLRALGGGGVVFGILVTVQDSISFGGPSLGATQQDADPSTATRTATRTATATRTRTDTEVAITEPTPSRTPSATRTATATGTPQEEVELVEPFDYTKAAQTLNGEVNSARSENDAFRLGRNRVMSSMAQAYAEKMAREGFVSHTSPDGTTMEERYRTRNADCAVEGEVLIKTKWKEDVETADGTEHYDDIDSLAEGIVGQWLNDDDQKSTLLNESWNTSGAGVAVTNRNDVYAACNFCA